MLTWVLHPLRYTRIQALSPAMGAALYVLQLTSRIPVPNTTQLTVAFRTWLCFVMEVVSSMLQDEAVMWFHNEQYWMEWKSSLFVAWKWFGSPSQTHSFGIRLF